MKLYYDPATKEITRTDTDLFIGHAWEDDADGYVSVKLLF